jgi:hypothetical protein
MVHLGVSEENHKKKKNHEEKHCSNQQCFKEKKFTKLNSQSAQYKKNKINKYNFQK